MTISLITPLYNSRPDLVEMVEKLFLDSVVRYCPSDIELILVDDCSPLRKETEECIRRIEKVRKVHYVANERNLGFVKSSNAGLRAARGDVLLLTNSDIRFTPGAVDSLLRTLGSAASVGMVGPVLNNACDFPPQQVSGLAPLVSYAEQELNRVDAYAAAVRARLDGVWDVSWLIGCCLMIKKELVEKIGGFDEGIAFGYGEDTDYGLRARRAGYRQLVDRKAFVFHGGVRRGIPLFRNWSSQSMRARPLRALYSLLRNTLYVLRKHGPSIMGEAERGHRSMRNPLVPAP